MGGCDVPLGVTVEDHDMIDTDGVDGAAVGMSVGAEENDLLDPILGFDEAIPEGPSPSCRGSCGELLGLEGVIETVAK